MTQHTRYVTSGEGKALKSLIDLLTLLRVKHRVSRLVMNKAVGHRINRSIGAYKRKYLLEMYER